jgi:hypothetical protein
MIMSGSRIDVVYVADGGANYCINVDESNIEMIMGAAQTPSGAYDRPPKGFTPRHVILRDITSTLQRRVPVLSVARYSAITGSTPFSIMTEGQTAVVSVRATSKNGEKKRFIPKDFDSGITDGD